MNGAGKADIFCSSGKQSAVFLSAFAAAEVQEMNLLVQGYRDEPPLIAFPAILPKKRYAV